MPPPSSRTTQGGHSGAPDEKTPGASMITGRPTTHAGRAAHWDTVYDTKGEDGVSWYQSKPAVTLELLDVVDIDRHACVIDLGGGASVVVDHLLAGGFSDISVLDLSRVALDRTRARLGADAERVHWLHRDVFDWVPDRRYDLWHDRAIVATFDVDGPTHCSGLPVVRYSAEDLASVFAPHLELVTFRREEHITPAGLIQPFTWVLLTVTSHLT